MLRVEYLDISVIETLKKLEEKSRTDLLSSLVDIFVRNAPEVVQDMLKTFNLGDFHNLANLAHSLRSSSGNLGAIKIYACAAEIEEHITDEQNKSPDKGFLEGKLCELQNVLQPTINELVLL